MKDKIIFWLNDDFIHFGIAKFLQDMYECDLYAIIAVTDTPKKFFQNQEFIKFNKTWYYFDHVSPKSNKPDLQYLSSFEEKYKINLWLLAQNERFFYRFNQYYKFSNDEILSILEQECKLFEKIIDEINPDFMITNITTQHHNHLFYEFCKSKNVKILKLRSTPFGYRYMISQDSEKIDTIGDVTFPRTSRTIEELKNYFKGHDSFKQGIEYLNTFQKSKLDYLKAAVQFLLSNNSNEKTHYTYYGRTKLRVIIKILVSILKRKYRKFFMNRKFSHEIDDKIPFVYYPLHLEEERVLLIGAPFYTNQIEVIRHIAKSMPAGYQLYVKEHPMMDLRNWRSISDYRQIMAIPNVHLIHPSIKSEEILEKCSLVITINGTASLEAAFFGKPSIIFADMDFSSLSFVYRLKSIEELPYAIRTSLQKKVDLTTLNDYVNVVDANSFEFDLAGFIVEMENHFHFGGFLVNVEISMEKMKSFLEKHSSSFKKLTSEHIKKIKQHKECKSNMV